MHHMFKTLIGILQHNPETVIAHCILPITHSLPLKLQIPQSN